MPSAPRPLPKFVRMVHPLFGNRLVRRSQEGQLSGRWKRVTPKSRSTTTAADTSTTETGTTAPDKSKED